MGLNKANKTSFQKGIIPWNKGHVYTHAINEKNCQYCNKLFPRPAKIYGKQWNNRKYCSRICKGKDIFPIWLKELSEVVKENRGKKISKSLTGRKLSAEHVEKLRLAPLGKPGRNLGRTWTIPLEKRVNMGINRRGEKAWNWNGGITSEKKLLRASPQWREWRKQVFERDGYRCMDCGDNSYLEPHHIIPLRVDMGKIFNINNGITLCRECHKKTLWKEESLANVYLSMIIRQA